VPQTNQDKRGIWTRHQGEWGNHQIVVPPVQTGLTLLKRTSFETAPLGHTTSMPEIAHYAETAKRAMIVNSHGSRVLRHNLNTVDDRPDPITGQMPEGSFTHYFNCKLFANKNLYPQQTWKVRQRFGHSYWCSNVAEGPFPPTVGDGKYFLQDVSKRQLGPYFGFKNFPDTRNITLVAGNDSNSNQTFSHPTAGGWTNRPEGWKHSTTGAALNNLTLTPASGFIFRTDGVFYTLTIEIKYNPGGIGYNKVRFRSDTGEIYHDLKHGNSDVNGWINFPLEWEFEGARAYSNPIAFTAGRQDVTTHPEIYNDVCGAYEILWYEYYSGVMPDVIA